MTAPIAYKWLGKKQIFMIPIFGWLMYEWLGPLPAPLALPDASGFGKLPSRLRKKKTRFAYITTQKNHYWNTGYSKKKYYCCQKYLTRLGIKSEIVRY